MKVVAYILAGIAVSFAGSLLALWTVSMILQKKMGDMMKGMEGA